MESLRRGQETLNSFFVDGWRAAGEALAARKDGHRPLARKAVPEVGDGKPVWHVHRSFDARLTRYPTGSDREDRQRTALLTKFAQHKIHTAYRRAHWLREWRKACDTRRTGNPQSGGAVSEAQAAERIIAEARAVEGDALPISFRTLQLWRKSYYATGADGAVRGVEALIDRRGAEMVAFRIHLGRASEAVEYFYGLFHVQAGPTNAARRARKRTGVDAEATVTVTADDLAYADERLRPDASEIEAVKQRRSRAVEVQTA